MMVTIEVDVVAEVDTAVEVDVDLSRFGTVDLLDELRTRKASLDIPEIIEMLVWWGCPPEAIQPLREWAKVLVVGPEELDAWIAAATKGA